MADVDIENQALVLDLFGQWPAFHAAEIVSLRFERDGPGQWPVIVLQLEAAGGLDKAAGILAQDFLIGFLFVGVHYYELPGFNHQNVIFSLGFTKEDELIICDLEPCYGLYGHIAAERVIIKSAVRMSDQLPQP